MHKILPLPSGDLLLVDRQVVPDTWEVTTWRSNGVMERSVRPVYRDTEISQFPAVSSLSGPFDVEEPLTPEELEEKRLRSLQASARRAKTTCRRVIITEGFDELLTCTYRQNQGDRDLCKTHFHTWVRRMKNAFGHDETYVDRQGKTRTRRVPGDFRFCASFERQERGCMHIHIATRRLPVHALYKGVRIKAWEVGTKIWRDIVGEDNGLVFVGGRSRTGAPRRMRQSLAKMASYVSKYILKDVEEVPSGSNRYSRSNGTVIGKPDKLVLECTFAELQSVIFEVPSVGLDGVIAHRIGKWGDSVWLCTEEIPPEKLGWVRVH